MALGKDMRCRGIDVYNLCETDETAVSVTTYVGHSTSTGPKVAIKRKRDMFYQLSNGGAEVIGTIDAMMYRKNQNQDKLKKSLRRMIQGILQMQKLWMKREIRMFHMCKMT